MMDKAILTVNLAALTENYKLLQGKAWPAEVAAAVKANAYGLGLRAVAETLYDAGCRTFFVAHFSEALELRSLLRGVTIAPLHGVWKSDFETAVFNMITPVLNDYTAIENWSAFARKTEKHLPAIIHIDTGMNRLGLSPEELERLINNTKILDGLNIKTWMSHLACADEADSPMTIVQRDRFIGALHKLPKAPASLSSSSGLFRGSSFLFDLVRPGIALYGGNPTPWLSNPMQNVVSLEAPILQIRKAAKGSTVGYGATHSIQHESRLATLALGYADGYCRALSDKGVVRIGTFSAPVVGRISMDLVTIDVTEIPEVLVHTGSMAELIGKHRTIDQIAAESGAICYEILTGIGDRVVRAYKPAPPFAEEVAA